MHEAEWTLLSLLYRFYSYIFYKQIIELIKSECFDDSHFDGTNSNEIFIF